MWCAVQRDKILTPCCFLQCIPCCCQRPFLWYLVPQHKWEILVFRCICIYMRSHCKIQQCPASRTLYPCSTETRESSPKANRFPETQGPREEGGGDGFPSTSRFLVEFGHSPHFWSIFPNLFLCQLIDQFYGVLASFCIWKRFSIVAAPLIFTMAILRGDLKIWSKLILGTN